MYAYIKPPLLPPALGRYKNLLLHFTGKVQREETLSPFGDVVTAQGERLSFPQPRASPNGAALEPCVTWYGPWHIPAPANIQGQPFPTKRHS